MEMGKILSADILDIIFDQRNKAYGAYDLRKNYRQRLTKALVATLLLVVLICLTYVLIGSMKSGKDELLATKDITLEKAPPVEPKTELPPPPPPPPPQAPPPAVKMLIYTNPIIVQDPPEDEKPPEQKDLENARIGTVNTQGTDDAGIVGPPVEAAKAVVDAPKQKEEEPVIFTKVEIESEYPAGKPAWAAFVGRNLVYPQDAIDIGKQGTVMVQFIVNTEGNISDVKAISGPEELYEAAVKVIRKSGKWTVAIQNGNKVNSYKRQPITFKLDE